MRKIEQDMLKAIRARRRFNSGNTMVMRDNTYNRCEVFLFGNHIANVYDDGWVQPNVYTVAEHPTATTKSRLRALGVNITQAKRTIFIDGLPVASC